jgi:hypothetical protein
MPIAKPPPNANNVFAEDYETPTLRRKPALILDLSVEVKHPDLFVARRTFVVDLFSSQSQWGSWNWVDDRRLLRRCRVHTVRTVARKHERLGSFGPVDFLDILWSWRTLYTRFVL